MTAPVDREFQVPRRGHIRDKVILATFRAGLRTKVNPTTGALFTEDELQRITQPESRFWREAEAIDITEQMSARRAIFLSDQIRIERAHTAFLEGYHARLTGEARLSATGGAGLVNVPATPGTIITGSTTVPDAGAYWARDPAGKKYQVYTTEVTPGSGVAQVVMVGLDTGLDTNLAAGTQLSWITKDPGMAQIATVAENFTGGTPLETDADWASRMAGNRRHKQGAGNDAQIRGWARAATNSVEDAFVYPTAFHAGSTLVAITQKRTKLPVPDKSPLGRMPNAFTLGAVISYLTPPNSGVLPRQDYLIVTGFNGEPSDVSLRLQLPKASSAGWSDAYPFPSYHATTPRISSVTTSSDFEITCPGDATLPGQDALATLAGQNAPSLMLWDEDNSEFVEVEVSSIEDLGGNVYRVICSDPGASVAVTNARVCPGMGRHAIVSQAIRDYFDALGPGNLFDLTADIRGARCERFVSPGEAWPYRAGAVLATRVIEDLGGTAADGVLDSISLTEPSYPTNLVLGPNMIVAGKAAVFAL